jgi:acyl carrier protein
MDPIIRTIFDAVDQVNEHLPNQHKIEKSLQTVLLDNSRGLDSLTIVTLIVAIEQRIEEQYGKAINLADGESLPRTVNPFISIEKLADHISLLIGAAKS